MRSNRVNASTTVPMRVEYMHTFASCLKFTMQQMENGETVDAMTGLPLQQVFKNLINGFQQTIDMEVSLK